METSSINGYIIAHNLQHPFTSLKFLKRNLYKKEITDQHEHFLLTQFLRTQTERTIIIPIDNNEEEKTPTTVTLPITANNVTTSYRVTSLVGQSDTVAHRAIMILGREMLMAFDVNNGSFRLKSVIP